MGTGEHAFVSDKKKKKRRGVSLETKSFWKEATQTKGIDCTLHFLIFYPPPGGLNKTCQFWSIGGNLSHGLQSTSSGLLMHCLRHLWRVEWLHMLMTNRTRNRFPVRDMKT